MSNEQNAEGFWDHIFSVCVKRGFNVDEAASYADEALQKWKERWVKPLGVAVTRHG